MNERMGRKKLTVISFIGPSASGKSTALNELSDSYNVIPERYMELNKHQIDNRLITSKWAYFNYWFDGIFKALHQNQRLLLTDRCPIDCCAYIEKDTESLTKIINASFGELKNFGVYHIIILVTAEFDVLQKRIDKRLSKERRRKKYHEDDANHNLRAYNFFHNNLNFWDHVIDTSNKSILETKDSFETKIKKYS